MVFFMLSSQYYNWEAASFKMIIFYSSSPAASCNYYKTANYKAGIYEPFFFFFKYVSSAHGSVITSHNKTVVNKSYLKSGTQRHRENYAFFSVSSRIYNNYYSITRLTWPVIKQDKSSHIHLPYAPHDRSHIFGQKSKQTS